jgi:magnesium-transporting ATPase (P-type)
MVNEGQRIPADCLVLESADFEVDEEPAKKLRLQRDENGDKINTGNLKLDHVSKKPYEPGYESNVSPFVKADSLTTRGQAKLLVCCTGEKSTRGARNEKLEDDSENTKLQNALKNLG